jgi:hypothetical protein
MTGPDEEPWRSPLRGALRLLAPHWPLWWGLVLPAAGLALWRAAQLAAHGGPPPTDTETQLWRLAVGGLAALAFAMLVVGLSDEVSGTFAERRRSYLVRSLTALFAVIIMYWLVGLVALLPGILVALIWPRLFPPLMAVLVLAGWMLLFDKLLTGQSSPEWSVVRAAFGRRNLPGTVLVALVAVAPGTLLAMASGGFEAQPEAPQRYLASAVTSVYLPFGTALALLWWYHVRAQRLPLSQADVAEEQRRAQGKFVADERAEGRPIDG